MNEPISAILETHLANSNLSVPEGWQSGEQAVVARQPIFDFTGCVWGYELLYRRPEQAVAGNVNGTVATASVIVNGYSVVRAGMRLGQKLLINFTGELLEAQVLKIMPSEVCIAEILEDMIPSARILDAVTSLKAAGYQLAVDDYIGQSNLLPFLPLADIVKVDVLGRTPEEVARIALNVRRYSCTLLAEKVENSEMAELCRRLGFRLFQGYFFSRPEVMHGKKVSASHAGRMRLLALCARSDVELSELGEAVLHDAVITSRLLRFANSAFFGIPAKVTQVQHALLLMGRETFMQWLCVNVLATLESGPVCRDMACLAAERAKFMETLGLALQARGALPAGVTPHDLFLAGLFSLLDLLLDVPVDVVLQDMPLNPALVDALKGGESVYGPWLRFVKQHEQGDWQHVAGFARAMLLSDAELSRAYVKAVEWSGVFFNTV